MPRMIRNFSKYRNKPVRTLRYSDIVRIIKASKYPIPPSSVILKLEKEGYKRSNIQVLIQIMIEKGYLLIDSEWRLMPNPYWYDV